jgi:hypothetical protein
MKTFYVTKWWLTRGILEMKLKEVDIGEIKAKYASGDHVFVRIGTQAFYTRAEAQACVMKKVPKKISALNKQIAALQKLQERLSGQT